MQFPVVIAVLAMGLAQVILGYLGIQHELGGWWAFASLIAAFGFRLMLPLTIGTYFGVVNVLGWPWWAGVVVALPGILLVIPHVLTQILGSAAAALKR